MFKSLSWEAIYRSDKHNMLEQFYMPALRQSVLYSRAVGYFSAAMLEGVAQGLSAFLRNDGKIRLIVGGELDNNDLVAIMRGYSERELMDKVTKHYLEKVDEFDLIVKSDISKMRFSLLCWLIKEGRFDIKIAFKERGMYHEKIGIFEDASGDKLVFQGSANETFAALSPEFNFESISVFPTWNQALANYFEPLIHGFDQLWDNRVEETIVIDLPLAVREELINKFSSKWPLMTEKEELAAWERLLHLKGLNSFVKAARPLLPT
jgi:hypothetical protein